MSRSALAPSSAGFDGVYMKGVGEGAAPLQFALALGAAREDVAGNKLVFEDRAATARTIFPHQFANLTA